MIYTQNKFSDRIFGEKLSYSSLAEQLLVNEYETIQQIDQLVDEYWEQFLRHEEIRPPNGKQGSKYQAVGVIRVLLRDVVAKEKGILWRDK